MEDLKHKAALLQCHKRKLSSKSSANKRKSKAEVREDVTYKTTEQRPWGRCFVLKGPLASLLMTGHPDLLRPRRVKHAPLPKKVQHGAPDRENHPEQTDLSR